MCHAGIPIDIQRYPITAPDSLQVQRSAGGVKLYANSLVCGMQLYKTGGLRVLYRGTVITWIRGMCFCLLGRELCGYLIKTQL